MMDLRCTVEQLASAMATILAAVEELTSLILMTGNARVFSESKDEL